MSLFKKTRTTDYFLDGSGGGGSRGLFEDGTDTQSATQQTREYTRDPFENGLKPLLPSTLDGLNEIILADQMTCPACRKTINRDKHQDPFICECGWRSE